MRSVITVNGTVYPTPLFLPVFQYGNAYVSIEMLENEFDVKGLITNAFFLYKKRELKKTVLEQGIRNFLGFKGLIVTDSGAFQQFSGPLYLSNTKIIKFQQDIGVDVISPLDLITPPGDNRTIATKKLETTLKRIEKGLALVDRAILAGVQQGGRFLVLRGQALEKLVELGVKYIALGSLVPFFTRNHNIEFIGKVLKQAREIVPPHIPIHLYGAGDPLELPFYIALGCDIFDSSSFIHYAQGGWYMTPYGALEFQEMNSENMPYSCECQYCRRFGEDLWKDEKQLALHNLWMILNVLQEVGQRINTNTLAEYLQEVLEIHQQWFPQSQLARSWNALCGS
jgi:7-cyano-7-deazaguanine tRNA-ribosyltransferase